MSILRTSSSFYLIRLMGYGTSCCGQVFLHYTPVQSLTDTSRGVITIFQEFLTLMLSLKLLSMFEKHPSESHWNLPSVGFHQIRVWPVFYPGNIKKLHLKKTNTGREENITEPTVTMETDSKLVRTLERNRKSLQTYPCKLWDDF